MATPVQSRPMKVLIVVNDAPYGTEKAYNALRLAMTLQREHRVQLRLFLLADAVTCALPGQTTPNGYYNVARMVRAIVEAGGEVKACGSCMDARGTAELERLPGVERATMKDLAAWTVDSDRVLTF